MNDEKIKELCTKLRISIAEREKAVQRLFGVGRFVDAAFSEGCAAAAKETLAVLETLLQEEATNEHTN